MRKIALLSHVLPPSPSGQSVMLYRILSGVSSAEYYLVASRLQQDDIDTLHLQSQIYILPPEPELRLKILYLSSVINLFNRIFARTRNLLAVLKLEPAQAIVACSGDLVDIPAAFLASRYVHIPFYAYIFDDYVYQWVGKQRIFAQFISSYIFKNAAGIIAPNEFICEEYHRRYGVKQMLVRNPCDESQLEHIPFTDWPAEHGKIKIIYTGAIYHANYDCFQNLIAAMDQIKEFPIELHIFTAQEEEQLKVQGISGDRVFVHSHVPYKEILEQQRRADILFLPLAFNSPIPEVIRTSAPGKMGEYLASGRLVLAHIPADSFVADYCSRHGCAAVASRNDGKALAQEILLIITDGNYRARIIHNALYRAQADFHPQQARDTFMRFVSGKQRLT